MVRLISRNRRHSPNMAKKEDAVWTRVERFCELPQGFSFSDNDNPFRGMKFGSSRTGWLVLESNVLKSVDAGATWRYVNAGLPLGGVPVRLFALGDSHCWISCRHRTSLKEGRIPTLVTEDGGKHWNLSGAQCRAGQ